METTETVKKTPGDIKREEIAQKLGPGWKFFRSYSVTGISDFEYEATKPGGITSNLKKQKQDGLIEDWQTQQDAFQDDGQKIDSSRALAAYIKLKPKAQVK